MDRQIWRIAPTMHGVSGESPLSVWLEPGHHLVLAMRSSHVAPVWDAAAVQLRPDVGPVPAYPTLPILDADPDDSPKRFLLGNGTVVDGEGHDRSGEFTLMSDAAQLSLYWTTLQREPFDEFVDDRRNSGRELPAAVIAEFDAVVVAYGSEDHTAMIHDATYLYEFVAHANQADFRSLLDDLVVVSEAEWVNAFSTELVTPDDGAAIVVEMLEGVELPDGFDLASFDDLDASGNRYQVGAAVVGRVVCAWLHRWEANPVGSPPHEGAIEALAAADTWPILIEMERGGGYTDAVRDIAGAVRPDADPSAALNHLSTCDR